MKTSIVIPFLNTLELTQTCYKHLIMGVPEDTEILIIDNGSDIRVQPKDFPQAKIIRNETNIGVYPTFQQGFDNTTGDIVAFFHSDFVIYDSSWVNKIELQFNKDSKLGLLGFIGSNEIDSAGGRGLGTCSNFMGRTITDSNTKWTGSPAEIHGARLTGFKKGAMLDGCSMIFRRTCWNSIETRTDLAPHHFYDKIICCQVLEKFWDIGILGIECDHISGQTANTQSKYHDTVQKWCEERGIPQRDGNWDMTSYYFNENKFLTEYRDIKHIVPIII